MKYFCISDIHGEYNDMISALKDAGFDENNKSHILITLGDMFDRGQDSLKVYEFLKDLQEKGKAICLRGNHDTMFIHYLGGLDTHSFNYRMNGTRETLADFLHQTAPFESWCLLGKHLDEITEADFKEWIIYARKEINKEYPELLKWLLDLPYYYETQNYIFTHASIDTSVSNWHNPEFSRYGLPAWESCLWDDGGFLKKDTSYIDKTIVVGHFHTRHLREMYNINDNQDIDSILDIQNNGHKVFIDTCTNLTHKVNVYVVEDNDIISL